jgi:CubicO group peptidase (beta-lactamase class C family)
VRKLALLMMAALTSTGQVAVAPAARNAGAAPAFAAASVMDAAITEAIQSGQLPGAVVLIGNQGRVVYEKAYGLRAEVPRAERMTLDTIFDAASLTKVVATTSSIAKLVEEGKVRLGDPVTRYLPEFQAGKSEITVKQLLTHNSGLRPDVDLKPEWSGYETGIQLALIDKPVALPGTRYIYSDINFVLLGEIVRRVSGMSLPELAKMHIFDPLGMKDTLFQPPAALRSRIAPTEIVNGSAEPLRGVVHDPTCRFMGGIAGHAGMFTTARDLSKFAEMMLGMGPAQRSAHLQPAHGARLHVATESDGSARGAWTRLGHQLAEFRQSRRPVSDRQLRAHGLYRNLALDRSAHADLRDSDGEQRPSAGTPEHNSLAWPGGKRCSGRARTRCAF